MKGCDFMSIELKNITKTFDGKAVLNNFSLNINDCENIAVMGESGSGKTTLLNIIAGLISADYGKVLGLEGKKLAFVFQEDRLAENFTVYRNIKLACGNNVTVKNIEAALVETGLEKEILTAKVSTLSGGMKRRVSIIRALLCDSDILLLDEPTKGLDEQNKRIVTDYILRNSKNKTVIWVTHDEEEAGCVSDRIIVIN